MMLEHVRCDLCGSDDYRIRYRKPDNWLWLNLCEYPVVECSGCGLVYVNPRPTFQEMSNFYPPGYHSGRDDTAHLQRYSAQFRQVSETGAGFAVGTRLHHFCKATLLSPRRGRRCLANS